MTIKNNKEPVVPVPLVPILEPEDFEDWDEEEFIRDFGYSSDNIERE